MYLSLLADYGKETTTEHVVGGIVGGGRWWIQERKHVSIDLPDIVYLYSK